MRGHDERRVESPEEHSYCCADLKLGACEFAADGGRSSDKIRGVAAIEQVRAVSKERLTTQLDVLGEELMQQIASALKMLLEMELG